MDKVPLISLNVVGMEKNPGFTLTLPLIYRAFISVIYGDLLSRCVYRVRPYEAEKGATNRMYEKWNEKLKGEIKSLSLARFNKNVKGYRCRLRFYPHA